MLNSGKKKNLEKLTKEQLIYLIEQYDRLNFMISEILVDESKWHITSKEAVEEIRKYLTESQAKTDLSNEHLDSYIDMETGKISVEEYREIVLS